MAGSSREPEALASVEDVLAEMLAALEPLPPAEAALDEVAGLVLAEPLVAPWSLPRFDNAAKLSWWGSLRMRKRASDSRSNGSACS